MKTVAPRIFRILRILRMSGRCLSGVSLVVVLGSGCTRWVDVPVASVAAGEVEVRARQAVVADDVGRVRLRLDRVHDGLLEGWDASARQELQLDLSRVRSLQVQLPDHNATGAVVTTISFSALFILTMIALAALYSGIG